MISDTLIVFFYQQTIRLQIMYIWYVCLNRILQQIIPKGWYALKHNQPTNQPTMNV